ncbi:hypothetical protein K502DRAFT_257110 [Neoconidiobolus thromboides FSU 785]|nr:hypothetical protein K502DRAFT_257110 [Neoconidiobolus thromboides FSU 785]
MSIIKHNEHLHFEDLQSSHPPPPANIPISELSRHRHHPSLLGYYFNSTMGGINKVGPYNGSSTTVSTEDLLKNQLNMNSKDRFTNNLHKLNSPTKSCKSKFSQSNESLGKLNSELVVDKAKNSMEFGNSMNTMDLLKAGKNRQNSTESITDQQFLFSPTAISSFVRRSSVDITNDGPYNRILLSRENGTKNSKSGLLQQCKKNKNENTIRENGSGPNLDSTLNHYGLSSFFKDSSQQMRRRASLAEGKNRLHLL